MYAKCREHIFLFGFTRWLSNGKNDLIKNIIVNDIQNALGITSHHLPDPFSTRNKEIALGISTGIVWFGGQYTRKVLYFRSKVTRNCN